MYLSVQQAARRLGVSPVTIRRWTATGFLPCTRTAGGHRRIDEHDIDDLAKAIGGSNHLAAQLAREREVDVLINTSSALAVKLDLTELLLEIAMRMTSLLDCHFCAISEYDPGSDAVRTLAEYDHAGQRLPDASPYRLRDFPLTRRVLSEQITAVVNVDDPHADPAEVAELRREGDRSLLMVPLVVQGRSLGLLEVVDQKRSRRVLASAVASRERHRRAGGRRHPERQALRRAPPQRRGHHPPARGAGDPHRRTCRASARAGASSDALDGGREGRLRGAGRHLLRRQPGRRERRRVRRRPGRRPGRAATERGAANLVVARDPSGATDLTLAVTLPHAPGEGQVELLDLVAAVTAAVAMR